MTAANALDTNLSRIRAIEEDISAGNLQQAADSLNSLVASTPQDPRIYLAGALLARAAKNPQQEIVALQRAVEFAPRWPRVYLELAKALSRMGRHAEAVAMANKGVALAPREMVALEIAVAVANAAGDPLTAQQHLQSAFALRPADTSIRKALGMCLVNQRRFDEAEPHWRAILAQNPDDLTALAWLGMYLIDVEQKDEASLLLQHAVELAPDNPSIAFYLAIARGETPSTQPTDMIRQFFDGYANRFDKHLVEQLKYGVPKRVAEIVRGRQSDLDVSVLDLGCGTGLLGACLGRIGNAFVGVDVSAKMIEKATTRGVYTDLRQNDLLDELGSIAADSFDYIIANDVFIYVGDLSAIIPAAFKALHRGGALIFSCEAADDSEGALVLRPSKRYAHSRSSIEKLCREAGFSSCDIESIELRVEKQVPIAGFIALAQK